MNEQRADPPGRALIDQGGDDQPLVWPWALLVGWAVACVAVPWLDLQAVAAAYQAVGVLLTALGLAAIGERIRRAREMSAATFAKTRSGVVAWSAQRRRQLADVWARLTHKPRPALIVTASAHARAQAAVTVTAQVHHEPVDRDTISNRDWLAVLDDRVMSLLKRADAAEKHRTSDREEFAQRLSTQREALRAEIVRETRNGWQIVAWGLLYTLIGSVLGAFA